MTNKISYLSTKTLLFVIIIALSSIMTRVGNAQNLQISGGNNFSVSLCSDGKVYAWGQNGQGQLGRNTSNVKYPEATFATPRVVYLPSGNTLTMRQVDAGSGNTGIALACDGTVWTWGGNCQNGNIGNGTTGGICNGGAVDGTDYYSSMQQVLKGGQTVGGTAFLNTISYINASTRTSFAVEAGTGKVLAWGNNADGDLGRGTNGNGGNTYTPSYVLTAAGTPLTGIVAVEGSDYGSYALGADGYVYSWGGNTNQDLGRTIAGDQYYARRVRAWNHTLNDGSTTDLSNIVKMSGGDTHGLAIDASGNLWSWGGDWGPGQRGWGATGAAVPYATRVVAPGTPCNYEQWKIGPWITGVSEVSAGQQHSIALMNDGRVVTFGNNSSGQLGIGTTASSGCPVYVKTAAATDLTGIVSISDGDLWSFALNSAGQVYVWGENSNSELGIPSIPTTDQLYAYLNPAIPTACGGSLLPCPIADLGATILKCPNIAVNLLAGDNGDTYQYTWYFGPSATGPWTQIGAANRTYASGGSTLSVTIPRFYRVVINDTRVRVADQCGPCPTSEDVVEVTDRTPPVATSAAGTCGTTVCFNINSTGAVDNNAFNWYASQGSTTKLNTSGTVNPFCTAKSNLTLNGGNWEIWAEDKRVFQSRVGPNALPCAPPTGGAGGTKYQQEFVVYDDSIHITSFDVWYRTYSVNATPESGLVINVYDNDPNKNSSSNDGVLGSTTIAVGTTTTTIPRSSTAYTLFTINGFNLKLTGLPAGKKYWLEVSGISNGEFGDPGTCAGAYTYQDDIVARNAVIIRGSTESKQVIQMAQYKAFAFNWRFNYYGGYTCGKFLLTAPDATVTCLPVNFIDFYGENKGMVNQLNWVTSSEQNSNYFEVQRSYDGVTWVVVGQVTAAGSSDNIREYSFNDPVQQSGIVYYRISEVDYDGTTTMTNSIALVAKVNASIVVKPNPSNGVFSIETNGALGDNTSIVLTDITGRVVYQDAENFSYKSVAKEVNVSSLDKGIYILTVTDGYYTSNQKIIVE